MRKKQKTCEEPIKNECETQSKSKNRGLVKRGVSKKKLSEDQSHFDLNERSMQIEWVLITRVWKTVMSIPSDRDDRIDSILPLIDHTVTVSSPSLSLYHVFSAEMTLPYFLVVIVVDEAGGEDEGASETDDLLETLVGGA